jgi:hypothetical protein
VCSSDLSADIILDSYGSDNQFETYKKGDVLITVNPATDRNLMTIYWYKMQPNVEESKTGAVFVRREDASIDKKVTEEKREEYKSLNPKTSMTEDVTWESGRMGEFVGYYEEVTNTKQMYDSDSSNSNNYYQVTCGTFTVLDGDKPLIDFYKKLVLEGNTVNRFDKKGRLVINLNLNEASLEQKTAILNSSEVSPTVIKMQQKNPSYSEAGDCEASLKII